MDEKKEEIRKKKGTNLITLICFSIIIFLVIGALLSNIMRIKRQVEHITKENSISQSEQNDLNTYNPSEENDNYETETDEEPEIDIGNKIYTDQKYVFTKEKQEIDYDGEDGWNELNLLVINIDSDEIKAINEENENYYNKYKSYYSNESYIKDKKKLPWLSYDYYIYNGLLSIRCDYADEKSNSKTIFYNIDIKNKKFLSNEELLEKLNISKDKFESLVYDGLLESFLKEKSVGYYNDFDKYIKDIKFEKNNNIFEINYNEICKLCNLSLDDLRYYNNGTAGIRINDLSIPTFWHPGINSSMIIDLERRYLFNYDYGFYIYSNVYIKDYGEYVSNNIPIINLKSEDADRVNKELQDFFEKSKKSIEKNGGEFVLKTIESNIENENNNSKKQIIVDKDNNQVIENYYTIDYRYEIIDNTVLAILVKESDVNCSDISKSIVNYYAYNFDIETGKLLTNKELIKKCGYSEDEFKRLSKFENNIEDLNITFWPVKAFDEDVTNDTHKLIQENPKNIFYIFTENDIKDWKEILMN